MRLKYQTTKEKTKPIIELEEIKNYLRISHDYDNLLIENLVQAAIEYAENFMGEVINMREIVCTVLQADCKIYLKHSPIIELLSVHINEKGKINDISKLFGEIDFMESLVHVKPCYLGKDLIIKYRCGFGDDIPFAIKMGLMKHVSNMYELNTDVTDIADEIRNSYLPYRKLKI